MLFRTAITLLAALSLFACDGNADKIVVLKEGRVEQIGSHQELFEADGLYRELYDPDWAKERQRQRDERIRQLAEVA